MRRFSSWYAGGIALYIDGKVRRGAEAVKSNVNIADVLAEVGGLAGSVGRAVARLAVWLVGRIVEKVAERFAPTNILVVVDELFSAVGVGEGAVVVKHAQELGDSVLRFKKAELGEIPKPLAEAAVSYLIFTSEGSSRRELSRHNWAHVALMWNMGEREFQQLGETLGASDLTTAWRLCRGNPRCLFQLAELSWDVEKFLTVVISSRWVGWVVAEATRRGLVDVLKEAVENPDVLAEPRGLRLTRFLENSFVIELSPIVVGPAPRPDAELGIGRRYAWQMPVLRDAVKMALEGRV